MLHIIGAALGAVAEQDYADAWCKSNGYVTIKKALARRWQLSYFCPQPATKEKCKYNIEFAVPFQMQFVLCFYRVFQQYYRTPYIYSKLSSALFIGFTFFKMDNILQGLQNQMFSIFML
ncbi:hypothetical protein BT96DRAFT_1056241 [Gymnopus androsaceus JB14]|uniref:Uncharacterized protein n=1 Tax=Gymnopus androsaceus JB14 TaxID=1447944 RepID=A0A6A4GAH5_9AGAR|nr:hypothetical protein BT96DRAFT_1056241 [Gymnopus androsaceus JB14]